MQTTEQPRDMGRANAYGLFAMRPAGDGFVVLVHDFPIIPPMTYAAAHELFVRLIKRTTELDGNYAALACAWSRAAWESENARTTQARCTELIDDSRAKGRLLKRSLKALYDIKFALEQGVSPMGLVEDVIKVLDATRDSELPPVLIPSGE